MTIERVVLGLEYEQPDHDNHVYGFVYGKKPITTWNTRMIGCCKKTGAIKLVSLFDKHGTVVITSIEKLDKLSEGTHGISSVNLTWNEFYSIDFHLKELRTPDLTSLDPPKTLIQKRGDIQWE